MSGVPETEMARNQTWYSGKGAVLLIAEELNLDSALNNPK